MWRWSWEVYLGQDEKEVRRNPKSFRIWETCFPAPAPRMILKHRIPQGRTTATVTMAEVGEAGERHEAYRGG